MILIIMDALTMIFFQKDICWVFSATIGAIVFGDFEDKLDHLGRHEELLKDRGLLAVLGEDEELSQKLKRFKVLQRNPFFEDFSQIARKDWVH
jgi:hypothetical protein